MNDMSTMPAVEARPAAISTPAPTPNESAAGATGVALNPLRLPAMPVSIAKAIVGVCRRVKVLGYDGKNTDQKYAFTSVDVFLASVGEWCAAEGLAVLPEEVRAERVVLGETTNRYGELKREEVLSATYRFWLIHEDGAVWQHPMDRRIEVRWNGPQGYGSAESYVLKRFLRALFKVPTGDALDPASDMADPDGGRAPAAVPASKGKAPPDPDDDGLGPPKAPAPPGFTSAVEKPRSGTPDRAGIAPAEPPAEPPQPAGAPPFRVLNSLGESVGEYSDLKAWGAALKKQLTGFPASWETNRAEVARLKNAFLCDPDLAPKRRLSLQTAFDSLEALDPANQMTGPAEVQEPGTASVEPAHDPDTGELLPPPDNEGAPA
jgi:hypothetical protein